MLNSNETACVRARRVEQQQQIACFGPATAGARHGMASLNAPNSPSSWDPSAWERSILNSGEQAVAYMSSDLRRQAARLSEAATEENRRGIYLALCSSIFIGASFIIKKKGLILASQKGTRAGAGGYSYLTEPLWWVGMLTMIGGEFANFAAYAYAPAIVVTPLGASTIIISAILANFFLGETLHACGILACVLAVCGSLILLSHAPAEAPLESVEEIWALATQPQFLVYACLVISLSILLMYRFAPRYGRTHLLIYVLICSLVGSLSVVSCKALGIALKLTLRGSNQVFKKETFAFLCCVICCILVQMNYLNKVCARALADLPPRAAAAQPAAPAHIASRHNGRTHGSRHAQVPSLQRLSCTLLRPPATIPPWLCVRSRTRRVIMFLLWPQFRAGHPTRLSHAMGDVIFSLPTPRLPRRCRPPAWLWRRRTPSVPGLPSVPHAPSPNSCL